jgi:hypothetical protein
MSDRARFGRLEESGMVATVLRAGPGFGAVADSPRWGALRLVRGWLERAPAPDPAGSELGDWEVGPPAPDPGLTVIWQADLELDRLAATRALRDALTAWRAAEQRLVTAAAGTAEYVRAEREVAVLCAAYQRRFEAVRTSLREE